MRIAVLGSGVVGQTLGTGLERCGHEVVLGTRDPSAGPAADWAARSGGTAVRFADAAGDGELVVLALSGSATLDVVGGLGGSADGKTVLDVTNPLDFSAGFPPSLFTTRESLAEQVQAALPHAAVVKALNTVNATVMVQPSRVPGVTLPIAGDDEAAKQQVRSLLRELGWPEEDVLDLGPLSAARATEAYVLYWVALFSRFGSPDVGTRVLSA